MSRSSTEDWLDFLINPLRPDYMRRVDPVLARLQHCPSLLLYGEISNEASIALIRLQPMKKLSLFNITATSNAPTRF